MTRNNSGVSASRAPRATEHAPLLRVVTDGGGTTIPRAVLDASADRALADYEAGLRARLDAAVQSHGADEVARRLETARAGIAALADRDESDRVRRLAAMAAGTYASDDPSRRSDAHRAESGRPRLRLVPPPGPVQPATPCPPWCVLLDEHDDPSDRFHYSQTRRFAGFSACLDLDDHGALTLEVGTDDAQGGKLGLAEVDELIAGLTRARAELADALAAYRAFAPVGGAA